MPKRDLILLFSVKYLLLIDLILRFSCKYKIVRILSVSCALLDFPASRRNLQINHFPVIFVGLAFHFHPL